MRPSGKQHYIYNEDLVEIVGARSRRSNHFEWVLLEKLPLTHAQLDMVIAFGYVLD